MASLVVAHYNEDLSWVAQVDKNKYAGGITVVSKTLDDPDMMHMPVNRGYEASAYLLYIAEHWHTLSEWTVFVHGHERSYHHPGRMQDLVNGLEFGGATGGKYKNINHDGMVNDFFVDGKMDKADMRYGYEKHWLPCLDIFSPYVMEREPHTFRTRLCAQFVVHRDLVRRHSREMYRAWYDNLMNETRWDSKWLAITWEWAWFHIMTGCFDELAMERDTHVVQTLGRTLEDNTR